MKMKKVTFITIALLVICCLFGCEKNMVEEQEKKESKSPWEIRYLVDEFGDSNEDEPYIFGLFSGTYSRSGKKGNAEIMVYIFEDTIMFEPYENGQPAVKLANNTTNVLKIKTNTDKTDEFSTVYDGENGYFCCFDNGLTLTASRLFSYFKNYPEVKCALVASNSSSTNSVTYNFKTSSEGLYKLWDDAFSKIG